MVLDKLLLIISNW